MAIEAIREHYEQAVARADMLDQLRAVAVERFEQEQTRAEAAEAELRELRRASEVDRADLEARREQVQELTAKLEKASELRRVVDAWKAADEDRANHKESRCGEELLQQLLEEAEEALRHA
jgi:hypothetical protein